MKKLLSTQPGQATDFALLFVRVTVAAMMLTHGIPKLGMLVYGGPVAFPPVLGMSATASLAMAVFAEVFCSVFILFGFGTRLASIPPMITMLVAVLLIHAADPLAKKEPALLYLFSFATLLFAGSGRFSLDHLRRGYFAQQNT